jgi:iron complex transport system ATP-binding protein
VELSATLLARRHGTRTVLGDVSLVLAPGRLTIVVGPNGAGKSTLLRLLAGLERPDGGTVRLDNRELAGLAPRLRARLVAHLPQASALQWAVRGGDVVALGRLPHGATLGRPSADDRRAIAAAMARTGTSEFAARRVDRLSQGERARLLLARVLATEAAVLLLDEPVASLDPAQAMTMMQVLREEAASGRTVVVVMHDLLLAARFADRAVLLVEGTITAQGTADEVFTAQAIGDAYGIAVRQAEIDGRHLVVPWAVTASRAAGTEAGT